MSSMAASPRAPIAPPAGMSSELSRALPAQADSGDAGSLFDLLYDGFYMVFLLRHGHTFDDESVARRRIGDFLADFERGARRIGAPAEDVQLAKYAWCALLDETVLVSAMPVRAGWALRPLQLELFGEQLAGETFFARLDELRLQGAARLQVLEVFHMCLLLGFHGRYLLEGSEKLSFLTARLGEEIAALKGRRVGFAPQWAIPDRRDHPLRDDVPPWVFAAVVAAASLLAYGALGWSLDRQTRADLARHGSLILPAAQAPQFTLKW